VLRPRRSSVVRLVNLSPTSKSMNGTKLLHLFAVFGVFWFSGIAAADAIAPEPEDCPSGSYGTSSHAGEWCQEHTCDATGECPDGFSCESSSVCEDVYETSCGGDRLDTGPCTVRVREVLGPCETDADCSRGTCVTDLHCIDPQAGDTGGWNC
jgi:hypothetical protein